MNRLIIPGILTDSLEELEEKVGVVKEFSTRVSLDVIDGVFADNLTVMPSDWRGMEWKVLKVDVHLMVEEPLDYLRELKMVGVDRVLGQVERMGKPKEFWQTAEELELNWGWAFDLFTPLEAITGEELVRAESVLLMAVKAGFSGQEFDERVLIKIRRLREMGFEGEIVVDGGMNEMTIPKCLRVGASQFSVTSGIWEAEEPGERYRELTELIE